MSDTLIIRADSTFSASGIGHHGYYGEHQYVRWNYWRGDTLSLSHSDSPAVCKGERMGYCGEPGYKISLKDQQLTLTRLGRTGPWYSGTYTRVSTQPVEKKREHP